ncbi:histidine phosphatase family protein [Planosporangium sp. 12N6]|uniref:histidine phosphatase family protein n=1 Tax=Planosporangium spinosum TaxID=3402278 RepID=UPI003CF61C63
MGTRLVLVSHAPTAATRAAAFPDDEPLDERGLAGASAATGVFRRVAAAYSSPARRCVQTAAALGLEPEIVAALRDGDVGRWAGRTLAEVEAAAPDAVAAWLTDPVAAPHGGESVVELLTRAREWLDELPAVTGTIVAVTHPSVIRAAVVGVLASPPASFWRVDVVPLRQTVLTGGPGRWTLRATGLPIG